MPVKLRVTHQGATSSESAEYLYEQDHVTIGRGTANHLTLPDEKRIVSTQHAELRQAGGTYQLVDLGSKNFTYLDGERLDPERPYAIESGDTFRIGEFEIEFFALGASEPAVERTVFAADFTNPFEAPAEQLLEALQEIMVAYENQAPRRRDDALNDAFRHASEAMGTHEATHAVMRLLDVSDADAPASDAATDADERPAPAVAPGETIGEVLDTLLEAIARLVGIPWKFRHEFIGQTIMQSAETEFLYGGEAETIKAHLLDPALSDEERAERLDHLRQAAEAVAVHQVAMLSGYKASVMHGAQEMLDEVDPDGVQAELEADSKLFELLPWLASPMVLDRLRAKWRELRSGGGAVAERRVFRPAFVKAYLARMTAVRTPDENAH